MWWWGYTLRIKVYLLVKVHRRFKIQDKLSKRLLSDNLQKWFVWYLVKLSKFGLYLGWQGLAPYIPQRPFFYLWYFIVNATYLSCLHSTQPFSGLHSRIELRFLPHTEIFIWRRYFLDDVFNNRIILATWFLYWYEWS